MLFGGGGLGGGGVSPHQISEECRKPQPPLVLKKVLQYTTYLYCNAPPICIAVLSVPLSSQKREILQRSSHLYRSTPPICIAIRLPFVLQYFWENLGGCDHRNVPPNPPRPSKPPNFKTVNGLEGCVDMSVLWGSCLLSLGVGRSRENHQNRQNIQTLPAQPKLLQKTSLQKYFLEAIKFVILTKTLCIWLEHSRKRPQKYYKTNCFRDLFCNNFGQDGTHLPDPPCPCRHLQ